MISLNRKQRKKAKRLGEFISNGYKYVLVVFGLIIILYIIFFVWLKEGTLNFLNSYDKSNSFGVSLSASLLEDIIFFLVLGIIGSLIPILILKYPDEEPFDTRVRALMNNEKLYDNEKLVDYLKHYLKSSLAFTRKFNIVIIIKGYDKTANAYNLFTEYDFELVNMCNDADYKADAPYVYVTPDDVKVDGEHGRVTYLGTYDPNSRLPIETIIDETELRSCHIFVNNTQFKEPLKIDIPANGELAWKLRFSLWNKIGKFADEKTWFYYSSRRYAQNVDIYVNNHCENLKNVKYEARKFEHRTDLRSPLAPSKELLYNVPQQVAKGIELYPGDKFEIFFHEPNGA